MFFNFDKLIGYRARVQHKVDQPRRSGAPGHPFVLGVVLTLGEGNAPRFFNRLEPLRAVGARA